MRSRRERSGKWLALWSVLLLGMLSMAGSAGAVTISFDSLQRGEFVTNQFAGVQISAVNVGGGPDAAIIFDSLFVGPEDVDLQGPTWSGGNIPNETLGNLLILAENVIDNDTDGFVDTPDDEGSRPAGVLRFDFEGAIGTFGLDLVDIEPDLGEPGSLSFYQDNALVGTITFLELAALDNSIMYGDNTANRVMPIDLSRFDGQINRVDINMGGSGAVDNISYMVETPEPGTLLLMSLGLGMLARASRKR